MNGELRDRRIELACFAALATMASLRWASLVSDPPATRIVLTVALATAVGAGLALTRQLPATRGTRWPLAAAALVCAVCLGMVIVGVPARLLWPAHWEELAANLGHSLEGIGDVPVPYAGADPWIRLVILLVSPILVAVAAFAAFLPSRRRLAGRICALVLLVALYLVAVAWRTPGGELASGVLLLVLVCAWLWLPAFGAGRRFAASLAIAGAALVALPAAAMIDPGRALVDYRHWGLFSADALSFRWDQSYGPLDWPQGGTLLLDVASDGAHYWKTTNLDEFDGARWVRSGSPGQEPALGEPLAFHPKRSSPPRDPEWVSRINIRVRGLSSSVAVGAGTTLALRGAEGRTAPDAIWETTEQLDRGDSYTALIYDPDPSPAEMRAAGTGYPAEARRYVAFSLSGGTDGSRSVAAPYWGASGPTDISTQVRGTPYEEMYALARRITEGATSPYDAARRVELHLRDRYQYRQNVPNHAFPLPAFLFEDRAGYCQHFSGAMALILRMLGIPSRIAAGFAPGGTDPDRATFLVTDSDAHDWVEVFFPAIGWVSFEPTPAAAPADGQLDDNGLGVVGPTASIDEGAVDEGPSQRRGSLPRRQGPTAELPARRDGGGSGPGPASLAAAGAGIILSAAVAAAYALRRRRRSRLDPDDLEEAELAELAIALAGTGAALPTDATLVQAERELGSIAGPRAARYAATLRERRYRRPRSSPPDFRERRALRRALIGAVGWRAVPKLLRAIPPGGPGRQRKTESA